MSRAALLAILLLSVFPPQHAFAQPGRAIVPHLQEHFGLGEGQVRGALGALLIFAHDQLPKPEFDQLAQRIPNAGRIMQEVELRGIVTGPLDDLGEYEQALASLGIGQPLASQIAPAVVRYLGEAGFVEERDILARLVD